jgi:hypothetical protein
MARLGVFGSPLQLHFSTIKSAGDDRRVLIRFVLFCGETVITPSRSWEKPLKNPHALLQPLCPCFVESVLKFTEDAEAPDIASESSC